MGTHKIMGVPYLMVETAEGPHLEKDDVASESTPEFAILLPHLSKVLGGLALPLDLPVVSGEP